MLQSGQFDVPVIAPGESATVAIPVRKFARKPGMTYMLDVFAHGASALPYAEAGHVNSSEQFVLSGVPAVHKKASGKAPVISECEDAVIVTAGKVTMTVDKKTGYLAGYSVSGRQMLKEAFAPNFWRAEVDNDWRGWMPSHYLAYWKDAPQRMEDQTVLNSSVQGNEAVVTVTKQIEGAALELEYSVASDGRLTVGYHIKIGDEVLEPMRIGMQGQVVGDFDNITYFGRGPQENYSDRNDGIFLGRWNTSVEDMMVQYVYTQENGNRTDVRWIALKDDRGRGILIEGTQPLSVSAWNTTQEELYKAAHIGEAKLLDGAFVLNVDLAQMGVGGTDSWTVAARPYDPYRLLEKEYSYGFVISPL